MIARLEGQLESVDALAAASTALVRLPAGLYLEVLLPGFAAARLGPSIGQHVTFHTLFYLEQPSQGTTITPRLAGFLAEADRGFFQLLITVKGVGHRKALRAMSLPTAQLAAAIADRDTATLQSLPEIGKRSAETIIVSLKDKVDPFLTATPTSTAAGAPADAATEAASQDASTPAGPTGQLARDALQVLLQLGENRADALSRIDRALDADDPPATSAELVAAVYQQRR